MGRVRITERFFALAAALLAAGVLSGCGGTAVPDASAKKISVVATIFPEYDWIRNIVGENADHVEIRQLLDKGVDMHSFQPTAEDMMTIASCDLFVYVGGESDSWTADALKNSVNPDQISVNLMETLCSRVKE